jgi:murein DD-endopeptidase MepM/ murein hydrolase activator NlpD
MTPEQQRWHVPSRRLERDGLCGDYMVGQAPPPYGGAFRECVHVPVEGRLLSGYGMRPSRQVPGEMRMHNGWDLQAARGTPVLAIADGIVDHATTNGARGFARYGTVVVIKHPQWRAEGETIRSFYAHLDGHSVAPGDLVFAGQQLGTAGDTNGSVENPGSRFARGNVHLHFELAAGRYPRATSSARIDPVRFFRARGVDWDTEARPSALTTCEPREQVIPEPGPEEQAQIQRRMPHAGASGLGLLLGALILGLAYVAFGGRWV